MESDSQARWRRLREAFERAIDQPSAEAERIVNELRQEDPELAAQLSEMLFAVDPTDDLLSRAPTATEVLSPMRSELRLQAESKVGGRYLVKKHLGSGGFGDVFLAEDLQLDRRLVILKTIKAEHAAAPSFQKRFEQEAKALARLDHPEIVSIYDVGTLETGESYLVMQYIPGSGLNDVIASHTLDLSRSIRLMRQICHALEFAHQHGILHRDLKPANILIASPGEAHERAVLIDFGIARINVEAGGRVNTTMICGTPLYIAPEQALGQASAASDTYALGAILFEMLARHPLLNATDAAGSVAAVRVKLPLLCPSAPNWVVDAIAHAVQFQSSERTSTPAQFARELEGPPNIGPQSISRRRMAMVAVPAALAASVSFTYYLMQRDSPAATQIEMKVRTNRNGSLEGLQPRAVIRSGDQLEVTVTPSRDGMVYLYSQSTSERGEISYAILQPGRGVRAAETFRAPETAGKWIEIDDVPGNERIWVVWAQRPIAELEELRKFTLAPNYGALPADTGGRAIKLYLDKSRTLTTQGGPSSPLGQIRWTAHSEPVIGYVEFLHR